MYRLFAAAVLSAMLPLVHVAAVAQTSPSASAPSPNALTARQADVAVRIAQLQQLAQSQHAARGTRATVSAEQISMQQAVAALEELAQLSSLKLANDQKLRSVSDALNAARPATRSDAAPQAQQLQQQMQAGLSQGAALEQHYAAKKAQADRQLAEAEAKIHQSGMATANDLMRQMMEAIRDIREKLAAIEQGRIEANRGINRNL